MQLTISEVYKRFGAVEALRGTSFEAEPGEFFALLGPSGAGKTTLLRIIAGIEQADRGRVLLDGRDVADIPVRARDTAMVFQTFALYPHLSTFENLAYPLREARVGANEIKTRVGQIAEMLRLSHALSRKPGTLSGGEQQRCAIGRALIRRPKLLLLDEPLTNLDAKLRHDTRAEFKRLHRELRDTTIIYATPDQIEALSMGQRIGVLREGRIVQVGAPQTLYTEPQDEFVASLVGDPPINLIEATLKDAGGKANLATAVRRHRRRALGKEPFRLSGRREVQGGRATAGDHRPLRRAARPHSPGPASRRAYFSLSRSGTSPFSTSSQARTNA